MDKTALITGAASGIGYEFSLLLAEKGYRLILVDINSEKLGAISQTLQHTFKTTPIILVKDLCIPNIAQEILDDTQDTPVDLLINNAGFGLFGAFEKTDWKQESRMLQLHIQTTTHLTKLFLKGMVSQGYGKILNISSLAAFQPGPLMAVYYASKAYILSFSEAIANELKGTGVTVTVLCPGTTKTSFQKTVSKSCSKNKITFNMACPKAVVRYGYKALIKGKTVAIPGLFNSFLSFLPRVLSRNVTTSIVRIIQDKNRVS